MTWEYLPYAYPTCGLSHALLRISNSSQPTPYITPPQYAHHGLAMMCRGHNTPVDVSGCASSELIDLRDLQVEENVRKRPFFYKINPMPVWAIELYAKVQKKSEIANFNKRKY